MNQLTPDVLLIQSRRRGIRLSQRLAILSSFSILTLLYGIVFYDIHASGWNASAPLYVPLLFFPLWLPPLWAAWRLKDREDILTLKLGLALLGGWSLFATFIFLFLAMASAKDSAGSLSVTSLFVSILAMIALVVSIKSYLGITIRAPDWTTLVIRIGIGAIATICVLVGIPNYSVRGEPNESSAVGSVRTISYAQIEFAKAHPDKGFARSLRDLGPASGDPQIDGVLAAGEKANYVFTLIPGPVDASGTTQFGISARPRRFKKDGERSFYSDESGLIRYTKEDRPATAKDPPLL